MGELGAVGAERIASGGVYGSPARASLNGAPLRFDPLWSYDERTANHPRIVLPVRAPPQACRASGHCLGAIGESRNNLYARWMRTGPRPPGRNVPDVQRAKPIDFATPLCTESGPCYCSGRSP